MEALRAGRTDGTLWTDRARFTLRPGGTGRTRCAGSTRVSLQSLETLRSSRTKWTLGSNRTGLALWTRRSDGTLWSGSTGCTRFT